MVNRISNPCIRCGKERVVVKTWSQKTESSFITYTLAECPDVACQKIVDKQNIERENKRLLHLNYSKARQNKSTKQKQLVLK